MALIIDNALSGASSNSYVTLAEADEYFESRLYVETWTSSTDDIKSRALVQATRRLETEKYYGTKSTTTQKLSFPRIGLEYLDGVSLDGIIPNQVKESQLELALHMLSVDMSQGGVNTDTIAEASVGSIKVKYAIDVNDNVSTNVDTLPVNVSGLLSDLSSTVSGGGYVFISR